MKPLQTLLILFSLAIRGQAQCPVITCPSVVTLTNCSAGEMVTAVSNYSANILSRWIGPGNIPITSTGAATSVVYINAVGPAANTYTVEFTDTQSTCVVIRTVNVQYTANKPVFDLITGTGFSQVCTTSSVVISIQNASPTPLPNQGAVSFTLLLPNSTVTPTGMLQSISMFTLPTCGAYTLLARDGLNCDASYALSIGCSTLAPTPVSIVGTSSVCHGSAESLAAAGGTVVSWSMGGTAQTATVRPATTTVYSVSAIVPNGCPNTATILVTVDATCAYVWPGDANTDGTVDNLDVLELGLAANSAGPARTPISNAYSSWFAAAWTGSVSSGYNLCHADCDGDGLVNASDMTAVTTNFALNHSFKLMQAASTGPSVTCFVPQGNLDPGGWNKIDLLAGDGTALMSQLYGLSFEVAFDTQPIEADSVYLSYPASFLSSGGQNIEFSKRIFSNGKIYAATVRSDHADVAGFGKIAELWVKLRPDAVNIPFGVTISNVRQVSAGAVFTSLAGETRQLFIGNDPVGELSLQLETGVTIFPNPHLWSIDYCCASGAGNLCAYGPGWS